MTTLSPTSVRINDGSSAYPDALDSDGFTSTSPLLRLTATSGCVGGMICTSREHTINR
ncbi:hypothetical protein KCP75_01000 [Salmonella enterica subsp. enterica]|nr:hypothetical protein KCP75_01000 [Salmonella enterica subsp. enterica]